MMELKLETLTKAAFAPFGEVIEMEGAHHYPINRGFAERYHCLAKAETAFEGGSTIISLFEGDPYPLPLSIKVVERHPLGSQAFYPLQDRDWLVVVAGDARDLSTLKAFRATGKQGVNYRRSVWHHPLLVLEPKSRFLIVDRDGPGNNLEELWFPEEQQIVIEL
jgi:ureidoglycolate lyase